jgi:hypothetical protein
MKYRLLFVSTAAAAGLAMFAAAALAGSSSATSTITAVTGNGSGVMAVAMNSSDHGTFVGEITASIQDATPNTVFTVQRALDPTPTGTCDSLGAYEVQGTLTVGSAGAGAAHLEKRSPAPSGTIFDVLFQFVGSDGSLLESNCLTLTVK